MAGMAKYTEEDFKTTNYKKIMRMSQRELASFLDDFVRNVLIEPRWVRISHLCNAIKLIGWSECVWSQ